MRARISVLTSALAALISMIVLAQSGADAPLTGPGESPRAACSLTSAQERAALDAFDRMLPVIEHPRCMNCHGGVNPFADPATGRHLGGNMTDSTGQPMHASTCQDCHSELPGWDTPGDAMFFIGKNAKELCKQFKEFAPGGGAEFVTHIEHEPGAPQFIKTSFVGKRALNTLGEITYEEQAGHPLVAERPPGSLPDLVRLAQDWVDAVGAGWTESPDCGCTIAGSWHGTVRASGEFRNAGMAGTMRVTSQATVVLEPFEVAVGSGNRVQNYRATGGLVTWDAIVSGPCRGQAAGSMALDTLDIDGKPMAELRTEVNSDGDIVYQPTTGSWPERWAPIFDVRCTVSGNVVTLPTTNLLPTWWHYDIPNPPTSNHPDRLQGRYRWSPTPGAVVVWEWDLVRTR